MSVTDLPHMPPVDDAERTVLAGAACYGLASRFFAHHPSPRELAWLRAVCGACGVAPLCRETGERLERGASRLFGFRAGETGTERLARRGG